MSDHRPSAVVATDVPPRQRPSLYPAPFAARVAGREKRALGEAFGLRNFGVNLTRLAPGAQSALRHAHSCQDEFIYVLSGELVLQLDDGEQRLTSGMCAGFPAGGPAHCLRNDSETEASYLEIGDRSAGDEVCYPDDDLQARFVDGSWLFTHKDGQVYD
ncbi:MAG: cupin domain-containing protein [Xanthomonadales bacterium]|nr:cupin domain-containing protein [Xanthomonadales bacterium]